MRNIINEQTIYKTHRIYPFKNLLKRTLTIELDAHNNANPIIKANNTFILFVLFVCSISIIPQHIYYFRTLCFGTFCTNNPRF